MKTLLCVVAVAALLMPVAVLHGKSSVATTKISSAPSFLECR
jgi:hypothetical protein